MDCHASGEEEPTVLYLFLVGKERYKWAVCATFRNPILLGEGGEVASEKALSSFAASVHNKQVTISGLHLYSTFTT